MPLSLVAPQTPAWVVCASPSSRAKAKAGPSGKDSSPSTSKGDLETEHVVIAPAAVEERPHRRVGRPLPRRGLDVAVGEHEASWHGLERVDRRVGVVDGLQVVRPVDRRGDSCLEGVPADRQVAGVDVLGPEQPAVLEVVPDEVLGQRPVGAVRPHRGLPHVPVRVDHARHHDAAGGVDLRARRRARTGRCRPRRPGRRRRARRRRHHRVRVVPWSARFPLRNSTGRRSAIAFAPVSDFCPSDGHPEGCPATPFTQLPSVVS
jgi:hypothetical protein